MARITFEFYPEFDDDIRSASNKSRSSLRPLFDEVRSTTDQIYFHAKDMIDSEAGRAEAEVAATSTDRFKPLGKQPWQIAKAKASALKTAANSVKPVMGYDGEIFGRVAIFRKQSASLEFGGIDSTAEIGKGTGEYVDHPPYAFLRRAMDRSGE